MTWNSVRPWFSCHNTPRVNNKTEVAPEAFMTSQWPRVPWWIFALFRCLTTLYFSIWLVASWILFKDNKKGKEKWLIFLTNWCFAILVLQSYFLTVPILLRVQQTFGTSANRKRTQETDGVELDVSSKLNDVERKDCNNLGGTRTDLGIVIRLAWIFDNIAAPMAVGVTVSYWGFLHDGDQPISSVTIHTHGINAMYVVLDQVLCQRPKRVIHIYQPILFGLIYVIFSYLYYSFGGTDPKGRHFIYPFLNWEKPLSSIKYTFLFAVLMGAVAYLLIYGIYQLRSRVHRRFYTKTLSPQKQTTATTVEAEKFLQINV